MYTPKKRKKGFSFKKVLFLILIFAFVWLFLMIQTRFWIGGDKLSLAIRRVDGGVSVATFDGNSQSITTIEIPGDTQVAVSRGFGELRLKNIWQLSINEKIGGDLLSETVTKNFNLPVYVWADFKAQGLIQANLTSLLKSVFTSYKTNLGFGDKVKIALFSLQVKNTGRINYDLTKSSYLKKVTLKDGEGGYIVTTSMPEFIPVTFLDPVVGPKDFKVEIVDSTKTGSVIDRVANIIQVLGPKVASIAKGEESQMDCEVSGVDARFTSKVSKIFSCKVVSQKTDNFDLVVKIGDKFAKRF